MDMTNSLSSTKCILLSATLASNSNLVALRQLISSRTDLFNLELTCRIILTFLPEIVRPSEYVPLLHEASKQVFEVQYGDTNVDASSLEQLSDVQAKSQLRKLHLLPLRHHSVPIDATNDTMTLFLIHRSHRIDSETGFLPMASQLIVPFLDRSQYLRDWYIGALSPCIRFEHEYYPADCSSRNLESFEHLDGSTGVSTLLSRTEQHYAQGQATADTVGRDFRSILGPWVLAGQELRGRKRKRGSTEGFVRQPESTKNGHSTGSSIVAADGEWQSANEWLVSTAAENFTLSVSAFEGWSGPTDVDLGVPEELYQEYQLDELKAEELQRNYCQAAIASIYAAEQDTPETIDGAHSLLVRIAELLGFETPPSLATSVHMLPKIGKRTRTMKDVLMKFVQRDALLRPDNPLTVAKLETFSLLQLMVYSAYLLASMGRSLSVLKVAKLRFWSDDDEQLRFIQRVMQSLVNGPRRDESQWQYARDIMLWLRDWAIGLEQNTSDDGYGVFGKVKKSALEIEVIKAACAAEQYGLIMRVYLNGDPSQLPLAKEEVEEVIISLVTHYYDNASNGNKTRGGVKKASDIIAAFRSQFPESRSFRRCVCLIAATHALSFYSLTLQRGVPFQPVSIRVSEDPVSLIEKVLEQNPNSYTKLDDLIDIGRNLVKANALIKANAGLEQGNLHEMESSGDDEASQLLTAERRVTSMAIDSALDSDDFETAYSYAVNRLCPSPSHSTLAEKPHATIDDISWRAALCAGRYRSLHSKQTKINTSVTSPQMRRLEQRMELLSHSLQLAPSHNLPEVLAAWRRAEEELLTLLAQETEAEREFDDKADRGDARRVIPGSFGQHSEIDAGFTVQPRRKELGRGAVEEAPMGLFDVARGAAAAFGRTTSGSGKSSSRVVSGESVGEDVDGRQRKRDMVASAVTGGLASGIGWVLGARPVQPEQDR